MKNKINKRVTLIADTFAWHCPECDARNREITPKTKVECHHCLEVFATDKYEINLPWWEEESNND